MAMNLRICVAACLVVLSAFAAHDKSSSSPYPPGGFYFFKSYGPEQGLTNPSVTCLIQDAEGYLWAGTEDGLFRYDSIRFRRYGIQDGLPSNSIFNLLLSPDGDLYVQTDNGLSVRKGDRFEALTSRGLPKGDSGATAVGRDGRIFTQIGTAFYEANDRGNFHKVEDTPLKGISDVWMSPDGQELVAAQGRKLYRRKEGRWECRDLKPFLKWWILGMLRDDEGRFWLRTQSQVDCLDAFDSSSKNLLKGIIDAPIAMASLSKDPQGRIWTVSGKGLSCFEKDRFWHLGEKEGLPGTWANAMCFDREGNLWVGSEGVHRLQGRFLWQAYSQRHGLPGSVAWAVRHSSDGLMWAGTNRGLCVAEKDGWRLIPGTEGRLFSAISEDPHGVLWIGGEGNRDNTRCLAYRKGHSKEFCFVPLKSAAPNCFVLNVVHLPNEAMLIGTIGDGLHRLVPKDKTWRSERVPLPGVTEGDNINTLGTWRGDVWIGTDQGVIVGDGQTWTRVDTAQGLKENKVTCGAIHPDGDLWISYETIRSITRLRKQGNAWKVLDHLDSPLLLTQDLINSIAFDPKGVLWLGTSRGVKRWDGQHIECFGRSEGLPGEDTVSNAVWIDPSGDVWFGTSNGIARFQSSQYTGPTHPPAVRLSAVEDGQGRLLDHTQQTTDIAYNARNVVFRFTALSYLDEGQQTYHIRLEGFENEWRETRVPEVRYTVLPPGTYRFEARSLDHNGQTGNPVHFAFSVIAPWWRQWWALLIEAAAGIGLVLAYVRWRIERVHQRNVHLENMIHERTRELENANAALENANAALAEASMVDPLTELRNRRYLSLAMPEEIARVQRVFNDYLKKGDDSPLQGEDIIFFMVDIDFFKSINDTYGHAAGDHVLAQVSQLLRSVCREADTLVRWGGEEFLLVAKRSVRNKAPVVASTILDAFRTHTFLIPEGQTQRLTCSVGFAAFPFLPNFPEQLSWEATTEIADHCLYTAKHSGRNGWVGVNAKPGSRGEKDLECLPRNIEHLLNEGFLEVACSFPDPSLLKWRHDVPSVH
jgi:diguanylate cyclase (GGDEF)-like protein